MLSGTKFQMAGCDFQISDRDVQKNNCTVTNMKVGRSYCTGSTETDQSGIASGYEEDHFEDQFSGLNSLLGQVQFHAYSIRNS